MNDDARRDDEIFAVGYRRLPEKMRRRWAPWAIARTALALALRKRSTKILLGLCAAVFFVNGTVLIMQVIVGRLARRVANASDNVNAIVTDMAQAVVGDTHETLSTFIVAQMFTTLILLAVVAGGLVAEDRRTGALELYFSRPLSRRDYAIGKLLAAGLVPVATLVVPFLVLWLAAVGVAPTQLGGELVGLVVPGLAAALLVTALLTGTIVGASAAGERGRTVGIVYVVGFFVLSAIGDGLAASGHSWGGYLAPQRCVQTVSDSLLGVGGISMTAAALDIRHPTNGSALFSAIALLGFAALGVSVLAVRLRGKVAG